MPIKIEREYRAMNPMQIRSMAEESDERKLVEGYATTFDSAYTLFDTGDYEVREVVDRHAFDDCDMTDVIMQYDHQGRVFARTRNNTLQLETDDHGLKIVADLGGTEIGQQLYEEIRGGYTDQMSFGFIVAEDERTYTEDHTTGKTTVLRKITKISKLYDVSAVSIPANDQTTISARNLSDGWIEEAKAERLRAQKRAKLALKIKLLEE